MTTIYKLLDGQILKVLGENQVTRISKSPHSADYKAYLAWVAEGNTAEDLSAVPPKEALKAQVTDHRWSLETGGITLGAMKIATGRADQARLTEIMGHATNAGITQVDFKAESGWVTLTLDEIRAISREVALFVQACFSAERTHHETIDAASAEQLESYDIHVGWPSANISNPA